MWLKQAIRLFAHELKRGELTIIILAVVLAVSAVFSLTSFSVTIQHAIERQSSSFLAADYVLDSSRPAAPELIDTSSFGGIKSAQQIHFGSMTFANDNFQLAEISAVSDGYPLRGELLLKDGNGKIYNNQGQRPKQGNIWVESKLLSILGLSIGDKLEVGAAQFNIVATIVQQPDKSFSIFTSGPAVLMAIDDVDATQVIQPGSRITYSYLFSGDRDELVAFGKEVKPKLLDYQRWYDIKTQQSPLSQAVVRAEQFLSLASMLGIVLACVAVAVACRRYSQRHQPTVAVFKAMGASQQHVTKLYLMHWSCLSVLSISLGLISGYALQVLGLSLMSEYLEVESYLFDIYPYIVAVATGVVCSVTFALAPLISLLKTSPLAVIRGFNDQLTKISLGFLLYIPAVLGIAILMWVFSNNIKLTAILFLGALVITLILLLGGRLFIVGTRSVGSYAGKALHLATANLKRRAKQNSVQLVSFTIALQLLLLIVVVRNELIDDWQAQLPEDTPNHFFVNLTKQQIPQLQQFVNDHQLPIPDIYPVVRGRLAAINDERVQRRVSKEDQEKSDQGRAGIGRELNLTWLDEAPKDTKLTSGKWWDVATLEHGEVSVEEKLALRLNIKLGDELTFQFGNVENKAKVTSIREVDWQSMKPNFYMILSANVLQDFPATYITSAKIDDNNRADLYQLLATMPTVSVIDVGAIINQLKQVIDQVTLAIEFILILVVIAGTLVLIAQVQASMEEREREIAILKTIGAKGRLLRLSIFYEFVALGAIAGILASISMEAVVAVLQIQIFDMTPSLHFNAWLIGPLAGGLFVGVIGFVSCWRLLNMPSVTLIRRTL